MAGKTKTLQFPEYVWIVHTLVSLRTKKPYWQVVPCPGNSKWFCRGVRFCLQGGVAVSQRPEPGKGSRLPLVCSAWEAFLGQSLLSVQSMYIETVWSKENFHPDRKLIQSDNGPDPDPTQVSSYIPLFFPGIKFRPKHFTQSRIENVSYTQQWFPIPQVQIILSFPMSASELLTWIPNS